LLARPPGADLRKLEADLEQARARLAEKPEDPERIVWVGRRLGYLWRMNEAVVVFSEGIAAHRDYAPLYRHRGHRYISLRRFDDAIADLQTAAKLIAGKADEVEPDGAPNARNIPLTTLAFNVWYHLGVAHFLKADFARADEAFRETFKYTRGLDDNVAAVTDWRYMCLCRLGRKDDAAALLVAITPDMDIIENHAYHRRLLMYKGALSPAELLDPAGAADLDLATMGFGVANWRFCNGDAEQATPILQKVVDGPYWPAFGYIAAEADLARGRRPSEPRP